MRLSGDASPGATIHAAYGHVNGEDFVHQGAPRWIRY